MTTLEAILRNPPKPVLVTDRFSESHHGWKYVAFGRTAGCTCRLVPSATSVNRPRSRADPRINPTAAATKCSRGIRNTVGFGGTRVGELFNDRPRHVGRHAVRELNHAPRAGMHFAPLPR
jgi:hypothetical protein